MSDIVERLTANLDKYPGFQNLNTEAAAEIERLRGIAKNAAVLLEWLSAERSAHACDDREAIEVIRPKIVEARRTLSLSIRDANKNGSCVPIPAEWENWNG